MPDVYAGVVILLGWLRATRSPSAPGSPLLWSAAVLACLTQSTYLALLIASTFTCLIVLRLGGLPWSDLFRRSGALAAAVAATVGVQMFANNYYLHKPAYTPCSAAFVFARLHGDGLMAPHLASECARDPRVAELCAIYPTFPPYDQDLLWDPASPFQRTIWVQQFDKPGLDWDSQLAIANRRALARSPLAFARKSVVATARQFFTFRVLEDQCPDTCLSERGALQDALLTLRPHLRDGINALPQMQGDLPRRPAEVVTFTTSYLGLTGLALLLLLAWRRRDHVAGSFLFAVFAGLLANAFTTGTFSGVFDRYQSKVVWLAPIAVLLVVLRWRALAARQTG